MAEIICKRCQAKDYVKNGVVRGSQRYRCRQCACNFTATKPRGKPAAMKALALLLYTMGNMSFCGCDVRSHEQLSRKGPAVPSAVAYRCVRNW